MACEHWLTTGDWKSLGDVLEEALPHHVVINIKDAEAIFAFLGSESATGVWSRQTDCLGCDPVRFLFADPATAFAFKLRFG